MAKEYKFGQMDQNLNVFEQIMNQMVLYKISLNFKGKGKFYHTTGDIYEGDWVNGKANGQGIYYVKNGVIYSGYCYFCLI